MRKNMACCSIFACSTSCIMMIFCFKSISQDYFEIALAVTSV